MFVLGLTHLSPRPLKEKFAAQDGSAERLKRLNRDMNDTLKSFEVERSKQLQDIEALRNELRSMRGLNARTSPRILPRFLPHVADVGPSAMSSRPTPSKRIRIATTPS